MGIDARLRRGPISPRGRLIRPATPRESPSFPACPSPGAIGPAPLPLPRRGSVSGLLLARASTPEQLAHIGNQTGGRVFLFLHTDDFDRDYLNYTAKGVAFVREPSLQPHGKVAVFSDRYGNLWDLIGPAP